ncbi:MAG: hypothetical protein JKY27_10545 [Magnetovibrio sp.]|nr:hypothetical protein [Magnetovibrio sp.]
MIHMDLTIDIETRCADHHITEVECLVPDLLGIARGKILSAQKFLKGIKSDAHRLPENMFTQTVTGDRCHSVYLGDRFADLFCIVKREEFETYDQVNSSWEREHLLLNV